MILVVNGVERDYMAANLQQIWDIQGREQGIEDPLGVAVALNGRIVRRKQWAETKLTAGDRIEIVRAVAGG